MLRQGTGPLLECERCRGKGQDHCCSTALALFGVELADISQRDVNRLEAAIMIAIWGSRRLCRAKEVVFALLLPRHRVPPSMSVLYRRMCSLA